MALVVTEARSYSASSARKLEEAARTSSIPVSHEVGSSSSDDSCCGETLRPFRADDGRYMSVCMRCGREITHKDMAYYGGSPWIGVDLDGTLAQDCFDSEDPERIGEPVQPMIDRVRQWLSEGKTVKIFTARASIPRQVALVKQWLRKHELPDLEVTNAKDFKMVELWDDRAVQVDRNSGLPRNLAGDNDATNGAKVTIVARRRNGGSFVSKLRMFFAL